MASALITTRQTKSGSRYVVRYRLGGRAYPLVHGGSFHTLKEARARRDVVAGEIAAGRNPADTYCKRRSGPSSGARSLNGPRRTGPAASMWPARPRRTSAAT